MTAIRLFERVRDSGGHNEAKNPPKGTRNGVPYLARAGGPGASDGSAMVLSGKSQAAYLSYRGRKRSAMFFNSNGNALEFIKSGSVFTRTRSDRTIETATVVSVAADTFGIPHVRYELFCEKPHAIAGFCEGTRVLALKTFTEMYRERPAH